MLRSLAGISTRIPRRFFSSEVSDEYYYSRVFVGKPAPSFTTTAVVDKAFKPFASGDLLGSWSVLFFYPLDWTFVCPTEIIEFSEKSEAFKKIGCNVVGCSVDSKFSHLQWIQTPRKQGGLGDMKIPLLEDVTRSISRDFGVLMEDKGFTARGTFIMDPKGVLRHMSVNDPPAGRNVDEVLRLVAAYQYSDKHGEVCPVGWNKAGDATIKPQPDKKLEYFSKKF